MPSDPASASVDRRTALKQRHRQALLDAARELVLERGPQFGVDELAARADVARRTVFNHFASLDDVVMTTCTDELSAILTTFRAAAVTHDDQVGRAAMFETVVGAIRGADVPSVIAYVWRAFGGFDEVNPRQRRFGDVAFSRVAEDLSTELETRYPQADRLEIELLVSSLMHGAAVIALHWVARTGAALDEAARRTWDQLLDTLVDNVRTGYRPTD